MPMGLFRQRRIPLLSMDSHIVPMLRGDAHKCRRLEDVLLCQHAQNAQPINFLSVPRGTQGLRITPSPGDVSLAVRRVVEHVEVWSEFEISGAPDSVLGSWSQVAAGAARQAVSG
jgi:5-aminolevulinate synthase